MAGRAPYDDIAGWYVDWVGDGDGIIAEGLDGLLPAQLHGVRVLDIACGHGRASRAIARRGATVVGVDLSGELIREARTRDATDRLGISYVIADVTRVEDWWDGAPFDGAVCEMALMDIDDLAGTVEAVASTMRSGGWFLMSLVHPCFPGGDVGLSSWPPDGSYFSEGRWTSPDHDPDGVRVRVGSTHRTISTYVNTLISADFLLERVVEPDAPVPTLLVMRWRRALFGDGAS